jgi:hypothetical protein
MNFILVGCILLRKVYIAFIKHTPAIATESFLLAYSFHSQHVSALSGHLQVNRNILYLVTHLQKTIASSTSIKNSQLRLQVYV